MAETNTDWVFDADLIKKLNAAAEAQRPKGDWVTDPALIKKLNAAAEAQKSAAAPPPSMSTMQGFGENDPQGDLGAALARAGRQVDNAVRIGANAATLGLADRFAGYMSGTGHEAQKQLTKKAEQEAGAMGIAAEIAGSLLPAGAALKAGATATRLIPQALTGASRVGALTAAGAVDGAALGALSAAGHAEDLSKGALYGAAGGAAGSAAGQALSAGAKALGGALRTKPDVPTREALQEAQEQAWKRFDNSGAIYDAAAVKQAAQNAEQTFAARGGDPGLQPSAFIALRRLQEEAAKDMPVTAQGLQVLSRVAGNAYVPGNKSNNALSAAVGNEVRGVIGNPAAAIAGNADEAAAAFSQANQLTSQSKKLEAVDRLLNRGAIEAATSGTGANVNNASRKQLKTILKDERKQRGFTDDEMDALREAVLGTPMGNVLRALGAAAPTGNVSAALSGTAGYGLLGGPGILALPAAGYLAKKAGDAMQGRAADRLTQVILAGGSKDAAFGAPHTLEQLVAKYGDVLTRMLAASGGLGAVSGLPATQVVGQ